MFEDTVLQLSFKEFIIIVYETTPTRPAEERTLAWEIWNNRKFLYASKEEYSLYNRQEALQAALNTLSSRFRQIN